MSNPNARKFLAPQVIYMTWRIVPFEPVDRPPSITDPLFNLEVCCAHEIENNEPGIYEVNRENAEPFYAMHGTHLRRHLTLMAANAFNKFRAAPRGFGPVQGWEWTPSDDAFIRERIQGYQFDGIPPIEALIGSEEKREFDFIKHLRPNERGGSFAESNPLYSLPIDFALEEMSNNSEESWLKLSVKDENIGIRERRTAFKPATPHPKSAREFIWIAANELAKNYGYPRWHWWGLDPMTCSAQDVARRG